MVEDVLGQSGCRIHKLAISQEQLSQLAWVLACWYRLKEDKSWFENCVWVGSKMLDCRILKTTVSQERCGQSA